MNEQIIDHARVTETDDHYHVGVSINKSAVQNVLIAIAVQAGTAALTSIAQRALPRRK